MKEKPTYFGIIPATVRYDTDLTANAKLIYAEITALTNMNGKCNASSQYFADLYNVSTNAIQKWLKQLEDKRYINRVVVYKEGTKQIESRYITILQDPTVNISSTPTVNNYTDNNSTKVPMNNNITYSNTQEREEAFNNFYSKYPRKVGKEAVRKKFLKLKDDEIQKILDVIDTYPFSKDKQYIPHPATWINQKRWEDEFTPKENAFTQFDDDVVPF